MTTPPDTGLPCWVYRSSRKEEMYLYLPREDAFDQVPEALMKRFGNATLVMELKLHPGRSLAREDVNKVMANLSGQGFHLQLPPQIRPHLYAGE